jgi:hypothetical protein
MIQPWVSLDMTHGLACRGRSATLRVRPRGRTKPANVRVLPTGRFTCHPGCCHRAESLTGNDGGTISLWLARPFSWDGLNGLLIS